ncbi:hypothetical protein OH77DRAFT_1422717 [Trametes cingulata]|nr:hypothetical protein OH77DRAFT_1422717 [Trametes cingulata]
MSDDPMNSDSDLTDIEDEEEAPLAQRSKTKSKAASDGGYRIRGALKVPRATTYTCQALYEQISQQDIDLQPEYQRDVVWPDNKQIGLIDSIFRNFYVPPVIFVVHTTDDGGERRVCVDGKQRLTSIYRFISGEIPYKDAFTGEKFVFRNDIGGAKGQLLPERYRKLFMMKQIVCMEYQDITPDNEREIFQRVQLGMALTPAERLQASNSPMAKFIRELLDTYIVDRLASDISWDTSRANDFRGLATAVYGMSRWPQLSAIPSIATIEKWLHEAEDPGKEAKNDLENTFQIFCQLAQDKQLSRCFRLPNVSKVAPVEFFAVCLLIHSFKRQFTLAQLSEAIGLMRRDVRKVEKDIRLNSRTMKQVLIFLKGLDASQLKAESGPLAAKKQQAPKRKRSATDSSEESPAPKQPPPKAAAPKAAPPQPTPSTSQQAPSQHAAPPNPSQPPHSPMPPSQVPSTPHPPPPPAIQSAAPLPTIRPPPSINIPSGPPRLPIGTPTSSGGQYSPRVPSTAPAAIRPPTTSPSIPSSSKSAWPEASLPPRPSFGHEPSVADSLMARMSSAPMSMPGPRGGGHHSPTVPYQTGPNDYPGRQMYDPNRDPRNPAYEQNGRFGPPGQPPSSSYGGRRR